MPPTETEQSAINEIRDDCERRLRIRQETIDRLQTLLQEVVDGAYLGCDAPDIQSGRCWWCGRRSCADAMELAQKIRKALPRIDREIRKAMDKERES